MRPRAPFWPWLVIAAVSGITHFFLVPVGSAWVDADLATVPAASDWYWRQGWMPFYFDHPYGGTTLTNLRAVVTAVYTVLAGGIWRAPSVNSHLFFSFVFAPTLFALFAYGLLRAYFDGRAALVGGLVCAVGLQYWRYVGQHDFLHATLLIGMALLAWRARYADPFREMSPRALFWAGGLSGLAVYTWSPGLIYVFVFWVNFSEVKAAIVDALRARRKGYWVSYFFVALFFYVEIFGRELFRVGERVIKLDSRPNLLVAGVVAAATWVASRRPWRNARFWPRLGCVAAGFALGFSPQVYGWLTRQVYVDFVTGQLSPLGGLAQTLPRLPVALTNIFGAGEPVFFRLLAVAVLALGVGMIAARLSGKRGTRGARFVPVAWGAALCGVAFLLVRTYTSGEDRYLAPSLPFLVVALGAVAQAASAHPSRNVRGVLTALLALFAASHFAVRVANVQDPALLRERDFRIEVIRTFRGGGVPFVLSDDYWQSNQFSFLSECRPCFASIGRPMGHPEAIRQLRSLGELPEIGILLAVKPDRQKYVQSAGDREIEFLGHRWKTVFLSQIDDKVLLKGILQKP